MSDEPATLGGGLEVDATPTEPTPTEPTSTGVDFSSPDVYKQFVDTLPDDIKASQAITETTDFTSLANQMLNAQSALGKKRLEAPQQDWGDDQWNDFYSNLRPDEDEYTIPEEVNLPEDFGEVDLPEFTDEALQELVDFAGELGLSQRQFDGLYSRWAQMAVENNQLEATDMQGQLKEYKTALMADWQDDFDIKLKNSKETFTALSQDIPELNDLITNPLVANHPATLKLFDKLSSMVGDALPTGGSNVPSAFGVNSVQGIRAQIEDIDATNADLILSNPSSLKMADRTKREQILEKRAKLYSQMYGQD
tara:strand:+ start:74 stop:1000 length:927 start_codon:yes stop_codon:yes gene_type:complete